MATEREAVVGLIEEYYAHDHIPFRKAEVIEGVDVLFNQPNVGRIFVVLGQDELAGYLVLTFGFDIEFGGRQATVTDIFLRPAYRRQGLGTQVFQALEENCRKLGVGALQLQPERNNVEALAFYAKLGFTAQDRVPMSKRLG